MDYEDLILDIHKIHLDGFTREDNLNLLLKLADDLKVKKMV